MTTEIQINELEQSIILIALDFYKTELKREIKQRAYNPQALEHLRIADETSQRLIGLEFTEMTKPIKKTTKESKV